MYLANIIHNDILDEIAKLEGLKGTANSEKERQEILDSVIETCQQLKETNNGTT